MALVDLIFFAFAMLPFLGIALAILYAGYVAYDTQQIRERRAAAPPTPDPVEELARLNGQIAAQLAAARDTLEQAQHTVTRGVRG